MKIKVLGKRYWLWFSYTPMKVKYNQCKHTVNPEFSFCPLCGSKVSEEEIILTTCKILQVENCKEEERAKELESVGDVGVAEKSVKDRFCRNDGRKLALSRALANCDKVFRKEVWRAYFEARPNSRDSKSFLSAKTQVAV